METLSKDWVPSHRAQKILNISRDDLHRMRDDGTFKLGKHYGAGPMTRSRDSYYWHVPRVERLLKREQDNGSLAA